MVSTRHRAHDNRAAAAARPTAAAGAALTPGLTPAAAAAAGATEAPASVVVVTDLLPKGTGGGVGASARASCRVRGIHGACRPATAARGAGVSPAALAAARVDAASIM